MKTLYPEILPYQTFFLKTGSKHAVYVEQSGNPDGIPVIFLHGGPCSGTKPDHRRFFNPNFIALFCSISAAAACRCLLASWKTIPPRI